MSNNNLIQEILKIGKSGLFEYLKIEFLSQMVGEEASNKHKQANYKNNLSLRNSSETGKFLGTLAHDLQKLSTNARSSDYHLN